MNDWRDGNIAASYDGCGEPVEVAMGLLLEEAFDPNPEPWEIVAEVEERRELHLIGIGAVWGVAEIGYTPTRTCPACADKVPRGAVCLVCHATARDKTQQPMRVSSPVDAPTRQLKGGTG